MISINLKLAGLRDIVTRTKAFDAGEYNDRLFRTLAVSLIPEMRQRIHVDGKKSDESTIGTYSNSYLKRRQNKPYNRTADSKVILSLTRQMENDLSVVDDGKGSYGVGFKNKAIYKPTMKRSTKAKIRIVSNLQKALWMEEKYGEIYSPTKSEREVLKRAADKFINEIKLVR